MKRPDAQIAIDILAQLQDKAGSAMLAYWVTPNTVLTLSGARAYCDGVFYGQGRAALGEWTKEITGSIQIIKTATDVYFAEAKIDNNGTEDYASYELVTTQGLRYSLEQTQLLGPVKQEILAGKPGAKQLNDGLHKLLAQNPELKNLLKEDSLEHIAFGILLGYPDKAILGSVEQWDRDDPFAEPLIDADIRGSKYYIAPAPIYAYPRHLLADPTIRVHEQLWSAILHAFYASEFHTSLAKNPGFQKKIKELGLSR